MLFPPNGLPVKKPLPGVQTRTPLLQRSYTGTKQDLQGLIKTGQHVESNL